MKKFFTLIAAVLMAAGANATTELSSSFNSWGDGCTVDGNNLTYTAAWKGAGYWLSDLDLSAADYIWVTCSEPTTVGTKFCIQYTAACAEGAEGTSLTQEDAGATILGAKLDPAQKNDVAQFWIQSTTDAGTVKITGCYAGTEAEYEAAKAGADTPVKNVEQLTLAELGSGWGDSSYDAATKTITYVSDWTGKGWWLGEADYSAYDQIVVKFAEPLSGYCQVAVEYNANEQNPDGTNTMNTAVGAEAGSLEIVVPLNADGKNSVKQIYIQNGTGVTSVVLAEAFVCTTDYYNPAGIEAVEAAAPAAKKAVKAVKNGKLVITKGDAEYNAAGQQVK